MITVSASHYIAAMLVAAAFRLREVTRISHRLLTNTGLVLVNWVVKLIIDPVVDVMAWAEFEGIARNGGKMTMTDDQRFGFRLRFE